MRPTVGTVHELGVRDDIGDEAELLALGPRDATASEDHAHRLLQRDHARKALEAAGERSQADARFG